MQTQLTQQEILLREGLINPIPQKETAPQKYKTNIYSDVVTRKMIRQGMQKTLKEQKRKSEGLGFHWTYNQCVQRYRYGGLAAVYEYKKEVKRCGGKNRTLFRISLFIDYVQKTIAKHKEKEAE